MPRGRQVCFVAQSIAIFTLSLVTASLSATPTEACSTFLLPSGKCCVFPFEYHGRKYTDCTVDRSAGRPWCATTSNLTQDGQWEYCELQQRWCPSGWFRLKSSCVFIGKNPARFDLNDEDGVTRWRKAREKCNEKGADLMIVRDKADLNGLLSMYYEAGVIYRRPLFLGSREYFNSRWKWLDGTEVDPALWGNGEPKTVHGRCGVVEDFRKRLFDRSCGWWLAARPCDKRRRAYICESPFTNRTCQQGFSVVEDRCYKVVTTPRLIWEDAQWDCSTQNSSLAVINSKEKLERVASLLATVKWPSSFFVGLVRNLSSWSWLDGASVDVSLFEAGYPKIRDKEENCIVFSGYTPDITNAGCNSAYSYACQSAQAVIANVAFGSVTDHSSLATGSNSSFAVDDNLTTCFFSEVEESPWLEIKLGKMFYIYKVTIKNSKNKSIPGPLTVSIFSRNRSGESTSSVCSKKGNSSHLEYQCIPPVKGDILYIKGSKLDTALALCHVHVLAIESEVNAKGVLREVWYTERTDETPLLLRESSAFAGQRDLWNIIQTMDATVNLGKYYSQKLNLYMKVTFTGYHTFYMTCNDECELWFSDVEDLEGLGVTQSERKMLMKLDDMKSLERLKWDRSLNQVSKPMYLSRCHLYNIEVFMGESVNEDHLSIGIKFPNGQEHKPVYAENLFWLKTGERSLVFSNMRFVPGNSFTTQVGSMVSIAGSYKYCCQGIFCPDCDLRVTISSFNTEHIINSSLSMNCRENTFNISLEADVPPGSYRIKAYYSFVDENATKHLEIAQLSVTAAILSECSFANDLCRWKEKTTNGSSWKIGGVYQGAYLLGVSKGSLESPKLPWKDSFKGTYTCLQFKYILPDTTSEGRNSTLEVFVGNEEQKTLLWKVQGYHGNKSSRAKLSWESKKDVMIELKANNHGKASAVIQELKIITDDCGNFPMFAIPGYSCSKEEFQCENLQCIKSTLRCDGTLDCLEGSDEKNCQCLNGQFSCSSGECLLPEKLRDGSKDCGDGQDEKGGEVNPNDNYLCFDGEAISWSQTCKNKEGCADGSHFSSICGKNECPLNDLTCSRQTGDLKRNEYSTCQIPFRGPCSFQFGLCGFQNDINSEFQWKTETGKTSSGGTGPSFDHTTLSDQGRYLYIEASNRQDGDKARLRSGWFINAPELCLQFWYHMYGEDIGTLNIYIEAVNSEKKVWSQQGDQGDKWIFAQVPVNLGEYERQFQILIEGVIEGGSSGDVAIDDVTVLTGSCIKIIKQETLDCYFENGLCGWIGEKDWKIKSTLNNGKYLYFKTDSTESVSRTLTTKDLNHEEGWRCLTFWYFIGEEKRTHTSDILVELTVSALHPNDSNDVTTMWSTSYRTNRWTYVQLPLYQSERPFRILFKGTLKSAEVIFLGIDDISFFKEKCNTIPNDGQNGTCTWVTGYESCCRFPFVYENTLYNSCTGDDNDRQWCSFGDDDDEEGGCEDKCLWTTESGQCCAFPFEYNDKIFSSCIMTPEKPRPWCATSMYYELEGVEYWDFCKDYCGLGRELCQWKVNDSYIAWQTVSREETEDWKKELKSGINVTNKAFEVTSEKKDKFVVILPLFQFGNITVPIVFENDLKAVTVCVWLQTNQSIVDITYWTKSADCPEKPALGINFNSTITVTVLEQKWEVPSFVVDQEWHHVCLTWSSFGGFLKVFVDGLKLVSTAESSIDFLHIRGVGRLIVRCPDVKNSTKEDALGSISDLNLWDGVLDEEEIQRMSLGCERRDGDLKAWRSMLSGVIGDAHVHYDTSSCRDVTGDRLAAFPLSRNITTEHARVWSPWYNRSANGNGRCLKFRYMIFGAGKNNLRLYQIIGNISRESAIWQGDSSGDDSWQYGQVSVTGVTEHQLIFEGNLEDRTGFISIGALYFTDGYCSPEPEAAARRACRELFTDQSGYITSPYYPGYYANDSWCEWRITAPIGLVIRLDFLYFHLEATEPQCLNDYFEVFDGNSTYSTSLGRFCGHTYPAMLESSLNNLLVVFKSDNIGVRTGFKVYYEMRKDERDKCWMKPDCPVGCTCYMAKGIPPNYVLEGAEYMESIPWNISDLTTVLLFAGSKITRLRNGDFYSLSSLTYIDLGHNKIFQVESGTFEALSSLETLRLNNNFLRDLHGDVFGEVTGLQYLDLGENLFAHLQEGVFDNLTNVQILSLRSNSIRQVKRDVFKHTTHLTHLYLNHNLITMIEEKAFASLSRLKYLHLHNNRLKRLSKGMFIGLVSLTALRLHENGILESEIATDIFEGLVKLRILSLDSFIVCCYAKKATEGLMCVSPQNEFSSCEDMMKNPIIRFCLWILGIVALAGNLSVIFWRLVYGEDSKVQSFLLKNLAVADFLMGVYLIIIAVQDTRWQGEYFEHDVQWRGGTLCQVTGALSMLSSEVSVMLLTVITVDRLICIVFHFRVQPLSLKMCYLICLVVWLLGFVISFLPMSGLSYFNVEGKGNGFYGRSTVCLALQLSNDRPPGWEYSVSIFIGFNLLAFLFISCSYVAIFLSAVKSSSSIRSTNVKRESTLAKRVAFIILTDFCCWMPVIIVGILSLSGSFHDPEKKAYVWMAVFVLPFNSSVNPILYTLSTPQMRDWFCKDSKSKAHGKRGVHYLRKPGALSATAASNPATKITTCELSLPPLNVANLEHSGCINKGFQDDTSPPENGNRLASVESGSSQDNSSATYDTRL